MELRKFETTEPKFNRSTLAEFSLPHIKVDLYYTPNSDKPFHITVTEWDKPQRYQLYQFSTYQEAFDVFALVNNTNRVALDEWVEEMYDDIEDQITKEELKSKFEELKPFDLTAEAG